MSKKISIDLEIVVGNYFFHNYGKRNAITFQELDTLVKNLCDELNAKSVEFRINREHFREELVEGEYLTLVDINKKEFIVLESSVTKNKLLREYLGFLPCEMYCILEKVCAEF